MKDMNNTVTDESKVNVTLVDAAHNSIFEELIDNNILELCFEVHRETKLNFPISKTFILPYPLIQTNGKKSKLADQSTCFKCGQNKGSHNFTSHFSGCLEDNSNSRQAKTKLYNFKEWDSNDEDDFDQDDELLRKGGERNKKIVKGKSKCLGNSLSNSQYSEQSFLTKSLDERKAFFDRKCGVITKRSKKLCSNSLKCSTHTEIERNSVRHNLLRDEPDNEQIDVDTVEKSDIKMSFSADENITDYPSGSTIFLGRNMPFTT